MVIGIDLGTSNTRILIDSKGKEIDQPSVITYDTETNEILAVGDEAFRMLGRTPKTISAVYPLESGVIAHSYLVEDMIGIFLRQVSSSKVVMPRVVTSIPGDITEVEKRAIVNAISSFGVRRVYLIEAAKAAALGAGLPVMQAYGSMIADIGGGTTDIAVMSLGGISVMKSVKKAGNYMDEEIIKYIRRKYNLLIGKRMAEDCKIEIGCIVPPAQEKTFRLKGRDTLRGLPRYVDVTSSEIMEAIVETAEDIIKGILEVLEKTPPELIGDIYSDGIVLSGGLARLPGFTELTAQRVGLNVRLAENPTDCVINGCQEAIAYIDDVENPRSEQLNPLMAAY